MTVFDFDDLNPGAKFDYEVDDKGKVVSWVQVRAYTNDILSDIRSQCFKDVVEYKKTSKHGQLQRIEYTKQVPDGDKLMKELLWDYVIMDWSGFVDKHGKAIPCTKENKIKIMRSPQFYAFIDKCIETLTPDVNEAVKESEKN